MRTIAVLRSWRLAKTMSIDLFTCQGCGAQYAIRRRQQALAEPPTCEACGRALPATEGGDWLDYLRADPVFVGKEGIITEPRQ
jgi:NAD-dependent SIR2 family protein deacetylase